MSEPENFLARWSRRKQEAAEEQASPKQNAKQSAPADQVPPEAPAENLAKPEPFDLSKLPSIESIGPDTDIRAFLQPGVPSDLSRAALRRAWSADPAIRDFVGMAENQWDFTAPETIPGFGPLKAVDDVRRLVAQAMGGLDASEWDEPGATQVSHDLRENADAPSDAATSETPEPAVVQRAAQIAAPQHNEAEDKPEASPAPRSHGSALPH